MKKYLIFGLLIMVIGLLLYYFTVNNNDENKIKKEIELANYCEVKNDCIQIVAKCPFDCYVYVNKFEEERIDQLIKSFESKCVYGCIDPPEYECTNGKCAWMNDLNSESENGIIEQIDSFDKCVEAGNPVMESYPRQCRAKGQNFTENIGNELEKTDFIRIDSPRPNQEITSPLLIEGEARGYWFFEGDFPLVLTNWDGLIIAEGYATAQGEWMTEEFVKFKAELKFEGEQLYNRGSLILQKDNPSDLPENDDALEIPIKFK